MNQISFSTDMIEDQLRNDFWREVLKPMYEITLDREIRNYQLFGFARGSAISSSLQIGSTRFNTQNYLRTPKIIAHGGLDQYILQLITAGDLRGDFNGVDVWAKPGDIVIIDFTQTVQSTAYEGSRITVMLARDELEKVVGWRNLHGVVLRAHEPMTRLLFAYLRGLHDVASKLSASEVYSAQEAMLSLLNASIKGDAIENAAVNLTMRKCILAHINEHLNNPSLSPQSIMRNFRVSRSHLYRAFEPDGGVAKVIRDKRLDSAYQTLVRQTGPSASLKRIAYQCGFNDGTQFTKAFKARFGLVPKDVAKFGAPLLTSAPYNFSYAQHLSAQAKRAGLTNGQPMQLESMSLA
ncbi:helix-turn-helix domain-containing protein [Ochrobactrum sp. WV_118_8]|uniref:Helix-turn-helix domain-containing protein n=1 Tax=Brucella anthropi TaxID=529 RepID=A0A8I0N7U0_BRUAN|nr:MULTISPECIES: helix-turn-helix domain-containing protein [Brucella/Ochrobactrum group]MCR5942296.1 helix-turn-helix domain-containing protein [Ochrobactrum sp. XJ1]KAB2767703.1 helix-turn-helix domain-containing protein [Brucella anthropi]MBE0562177.1 helix-turn-helix domain-containing protein [Brucella anthropi]MCR8492449.1 helix-turn-helix domain-containing protein [Brucella anthropi]PQZ62388.1 AraC family transcriptional regulator [Ochrobactrum sp. MYb49]